MLSTILMFIAAVSLSCVAGYYSVIGLTTIFSSAFIPVLIMAGTLETSKVITASWLYNNWQKTPFLLRSYLTGAVIVLMFITSLGIFGFLSKAHVEQAAANAEQQAKILRITQEIDQQTATIASAKQKMANAGKGDEAGNAAISARIDDANKVIASANSRVQPQIDEQQKIIDDAIAKVELRVGSIQSQIDDVDKQVSNLDAIIKSLIDQKYATKAQAKQTEQKAARDELAKQKSDLLAQIDVMRQAPDPVVIAAKAEITRLRSKVEDDIKQTRDVIDQLTAKLSQGSDTTKIQSDIDTQAAVVKAAEAKIETLNADKFTLETEGRKLEAETGPIKYIAQALYGDTVDQNLLEHAVRWIIMLIIVVFDPLALLMLIAANQGLAEHRTRKLESAKLVNTPTPTPASAQPETAPFARSFQIRPQHQTPTPAPAQPETAPSYPIRPQHQTPKDVPVNEEPAPTAVQTETKEVFGDLTEAERVEFEQFLNKTVQTNNVEPRNLTISFDSATANLTIVEETQTPVDEEPVVRLPVVEDDLDNASKSPVISEDGKLEWQLIDQLPVVGTKRKTAAEFLDRLKELYQRRLQQFANKKTEG